MFADGIVQTSTQPMLACQESSCLHKWARPSNKQKCEHTILRLIDVSFSDRSPMGHYACVQCGIEIFRPYETY